MENESAPPESQERIGAANRFADELLQLFSDRRSQESRLAWDQMSPKENDESNQYSEEVERKFAWLAEMFRSESVYSHYCIQNNQHGVLHFFKFGYEESVGFVPNVIVIYPNNQQKLADGILMKKNSLNNWETQPLAELMEEYRKAYQSNF